MEAYDQIWSKIVHKRLLALKLRLVAGGLTFQIRSNSDIQVGGITLFIQESYRFKIAFNLFYWSIFLPQPFPHFMPKPMLFLIFKHNR